MSTPTLHHRIKDRNGVSGAKITSTGKENPNPQKKIASLKDLKENNNNVQKPSVQPIPRFTRSNSAAPKGRSSSPFEFNRAFNNNDIRKNQCFGSGVRSVSNGRRSVSGDRVFDRCSSKIGSFRDLKENNGVLKDLGMRSGQRVVKNGDLSGKTGERVERFNGRFEKSEVGFSGDRVFDRCQSKIGSFRDLDVKYGDRVGNGNVGFKEKNGVSKDLGLKTRQRVVKSGEVAGKNGVLRDFSGKKGEKMEKVDGVLEKTGEVVRKSEEVLGTDLHKNGVSRDLSAKRGVRVDKLNGVLEKSGELCEKSEPDFKGRCDLGTRVMDRSRQKVGSLKDSEVKLGENVEKRDVERGVEISEEICKKNDLGVRKSGDLQVRGLKERKSFGSGEGSRVNKYPSKLHEKLAFLEGKVKRIASDIKKTKEMLDMNNPDSSKVILSDIQEKISGIEKAIGNVSDNDKQINVLKKDKEKVTENENNDLETVEREEVGKMKSSVKGLNNEELEARLFPHHKLLRDRTSSKVASSSSEKLDAETKGEEKLVIENPVEVEFLASLGENQKKVTVRGDNYAENVTESQDNMNVVGNEENIILTTDETLDEIIIENPSKPEMILDEEIEDNCCYQFSEIGAKTSTCGWFVADGEAALIAHDDGSCTYYDVANSEVKSEYKPPVTIPQNMWRDCWIVRAPGADGTSDRYVVAASAGNTLESGFCSWDFYKKDIRAFHIENDSGNSTRTALAPLPNNPLYRRNSFSNIIASENRQWWYKPCGPLIASTASNLKGISLYDIRDGEQIMKWEVQKPVLSMDYSSPLQWRNRGKIVVAEGECVSLWDVSSLSPQALQSISTSGRRVYALHVNNTDAELGGGVRQRTSSSEAEGHDGVFCNGDSINVLDFRHPSGIGLKISKTGVNPQSVFSRGDSIFLGCNNAKSAGKNHPCPQIQHFSLRKQKLCSTYSFPESNAHPHYTAITQVWGNSDLVMGVCGLGLFVFDAVKDDGVRFPTENYSMQKVRETVGPDDLYSPSFDYLQSRVLLISRDRPALWRYLS